VNHHPELRDHHDRHPCQNGGSGTDEPSPIGSQVSDLTVAGDTRSPSAAGDDRDANLTPESLRQRTQAATERAQAAGLPVRESSLVRWGLAPGTPAPDFRLPDLTGRLRRLKEFRGRRLLLVFSDPECEPCDALAPELVKLYLRHRAKNLAVVMISRGEPEANRLKALEHALPFPVLLQRHWEVSKRYGMFATPIAYLIDESGVIVKDVAVGTDPILQLVLE